MADKVISMPDGSTVAFPDTMSDAQINSALAGWKPGANASQASGATPQYSGALRQPAIIASGLASGVTGLLDLPNTIANLGAEGIAAGVNALGGNMKLAPRAPTFTDAANAFGITNNPRIQPEGVGERVESAVAEGLPYAAPAILTGGLVAAPAALSATTAASLAAEAAHEYAPDSTLAPIAAGAAAGYGVGGLTHLAESYGNVRRLQAAADAADANFRQVRDQMANSRAAVGQTAQQATAASQADFQAAKALAQSQKQAAADAHGAVIEQVAGNLAPSTTLEEAGSQLQSGARDWLTNTLPKKLTALWSPVDAAIPATTPVDLTNFRSTVNSISQDAGQLAPLAKGMVPKLVGNLKSALSKLDNPEAADEELKSGAPQEAGPPKQFTWGDVQKYRSILGNAMGSPQTVADYGAGNLNQLYAALTADMKVAAGAQGASNIFDQANQGSTRLFDIAQGPVAKLVKNKVPEPSDPLPGRAAAGLLSAGARDSGDIATLRSEMPDSIDHLAAAALRSGQWGKLAPSAQEALVPDAGSRSAVNLSLQGQDAAAAQAKADIISAQANHATNKQLAAQAAASGNLALTNSMTSARNAREAAQLAAKSATGTKTNALTHGVSGLLGVTAGPELSILALNALGMPGSDIVHGAIGGTLGLLAPPIARGIVGGVRQAVRDPTSLKYPALGATVGSSWQPQSSNALGASPQ